jgi:uncharacterized protein (TIGR03067 family)
MCRFASLAVVLSLMPVSNFAADAPLEGVWEGWVVEGKGENPNRGQLKLQLTITGNKIVGKNLGGAGGGGGRGGGGGGGDLGEGTFTVAEGKPNQMDSARVGGGGGGRRGGGGGGYKGIATLEGDTLKWCVANPGRERPKDFTTDRRQGQFLMILKKLPAKDSKKD